MFRPFQRPAQQQNPMTPAEMQVLQQANQFLVNGQPGKAAPLLAGLAAAMEASNHPRRAANLHAQASHAFADSQNEQAALDQARSALNLFLQYQMVQRTPMFYGNITRKMAKRGMKNAADTLAKEYGSRVGSAPAPAAPPAQSRGHLPTNCTKCGAPVHQESLTWVDNQTIECEYCGSLIRSE
jgi:hypothetical protein